MTQNAQANFEHAHKSLPVVTGIGDAQVPTVLSTHNRPVRLPIVGKIRAGIMVLTKAAQAVPEAMKVYNEGVTKGRSFDEIEKQIDEKLPQLKDKALTPRNTPYFTVRGGDFAHPDMARVIMEKFAEDRGDGVKRLYQFPIVFPVNDRRMVLPHELACHGSSGRRYWSDFDEAGERVCKTFESVQGAGRPVRRFGGRPIVLRKEHEGKCIPEKCPEYQARQCNLTGSFVFYIPGVEALGAIALPTNSFYSMQGALEALDLVAAMRGGQIAGALGPQGQTFYLTKRLTDVSRLDDKGQAVKVKQWLIKLEANADIGGLLLARAEDEQRVRSAEDAVRIISGEAREDRTPEPAAAAQSSPTPQPTSGIHATAAKAQDSGARERFLVRYGLPANLDAQDEETRRIALRQRVCELLDSMGLETKDYKPYAIRTYGAAWGADFTLLEQIVQELGDVTEEDIEDFAAKLKRAA